MVKHLPSVPNVPGSTPGNTHAHTRSPGALKPLKTSPLPQLTGVLLKLPKWHTGREQGQASVISLQVFRWDKKEGTEQRGNLELDFTQVLLKHGSDTSAAFEKRLLMESEHWLGNSSSLAYCIKGEAKILYARESSRTNLFCSVTEHFGD